MFLLPEVSCCRGIVLVVATLILRALCRRLLVVCLPSAEGCLLIWLEAALLLSVVIIVVGGLQQAGHTRLEAVHAGIERVADGVE